MKQEGKTHLSSVAKTEEKELARDSKPQVHVTLT
jgi:hypothetical protein